MSEIQQQIADGARPLARVGDVIAHGEAIPANVVLVRDEDNDLWERGKDGTFRCRTDSTGQAIGQLRGCWPLKVVEVDPEPQPADVDDALYLARKSRDEMRNRLEAITGLLRSEGYEIPVDYDPAVGIQTLIGDVKALRTWVVLPDPGQPVTLPLGPHAFVGDDEACRQLLGNEGETALCGYSRAMSFHQPAESGPVVLSLPQVLVGNVSGRRWTRVPGDAWTYRSGDAAWSLASILHDEPDGVTVEFAPPREPRTWPKLDATPEIDDLPTAVDLIERDRSPLRFVLTTGLRGVLRYIEPGHPDCSFTLAELRQLGEVREVLT